MAMDWNRKVSEVEKVYQITGTDISFSFNQTEFDEKAASKIWEIKKRGLDAVVVRAEADPFEMVPEEIQEDQVFLSKSTYHWCRSYIVVDDKVTRPPDGWRLHGSTIGYGIPSRGGRYMALKRAHVYYKGNQKTNMCMNTYHTIDTDTIKTDDIYLCHVFQSHGNYDPRPKFVPTFSAFDQAVLHSRAEKLESLINNPIAFMDVDEHDESSTRIANGSNENGSPAWQKFTKIKVLGSDGVKVLTLAICHSCNVAYNTGGLKRKSKNSTELVFKHNGTKTMLKHMEQCGQPHINGKPQGAPH